MKTAVDALAALPSELLDPVVVLPHVVAAFKVCSSEASFRALVVWTCEVVCKLAFGLPSTELILRKGTNFAFRALTMVS